MSLYQKYRAKNFEEILTQSHITKVLQTSLKNHSFGHAYLFVGTRGAGKTSIARIFARALNCEDTKYVEKNGEPCNKCQSCLLALESNHPDIIEMDAASNRGIEEIRSLKESIDFVPSIGKYKVYVIDEVHMMTKEAFNALLKTLEEPPKHAIFIMCTTEMYKLPSTIISRSQVFELKFASVTEIVTKLDKILKSEKREIDERGKELIANLGKGSFRDTESILEKVLNSSSQDSFAFEEVTEILGMSSYMLVEEIKNSIYNSSISKTQELIANNLDDGGIQTFNHQLAESIYTDIVSGLADGKTDSFKLELFDFLSSIDSQIRATTSPKLVYIAKILNFLKKYSSEVIHSDPVVTKQKIVNKSNVEPVEEVIEKEIPKNNPMALLRKARLENRESEKGKERSEESKVVEKKIRKKVSKIDFLDFLKSKNLFLYRFFVHKEFEIDGSVIVIDAKGKMEQDLLKRPQTKKLIADFNSEFGTNLEIKQGEPDIDGRTKEEKEIAKESKKVEDLSEDELKEIFS